MAKMIPDIDDALITNDGERAAYIALRDQLPHDWTIRFHYPYCRRSSGYLRDGEADFIVIAPMRGVLYLEVKASYGYDCENGTWYRLKRDGRREHGTNPFEQACRVKHEVTEILCRDLGCRKSAFPGIFGHMVMYPRARLVGQLPASQEPQVILAYRDMDRLHERLEQAFLAWGAGTRGKSFTEAIARRVVEVVRDKASFVAVAAAESDDVNERIEQLTRQQYETYSGLLSNRRALIAGPAGSGKTMLGLWTARALAQTHRVLFLCYNRALATWLQRREETIHNLEIMTFHSLCAKVAGKANLPWNPSVGNPTEFWHCEAPNLLMEGLDQLVPSEKYDVVLVDEGQDFHPSWWIPVELLLRQEREGKFYIFYDPDQAVMYTAEGSYPAIATTFSLGTNCRNTRSIADYCGRVVSRAIRTLDGCPEGTLPAVEPPLPSPSQRAARIRSIVKEWVTEGYKPSRIAVLSPYASGNETSSLTSLVAIGAGTTRFEADPEQIDDWLDGKVFWASTIKRFKGLEVDCLIVTDIPGHESAAFSKRDLYVAVSRARHQAVLIPGDDAGHRVASSFL